MTWNIGELFVILVGLYLVAGLIIGIELSRKFPWNDRIIILLESTFFWLPVILSALIEDKFGG